MFRFFKNLTLKTAVIGVTLLLCGFLFIPVSRAITLIPPHLEIGLIPGQSLQTSIKLFNESQEVLQLYTETASFHAKGETGQPEFDFDSPTDEGLSSWIEVEKGPIILNPGERYEVPVKIHPPANADPGGHYASVFFTTSPPEAGEGQVRIASKVGTLLLTRVEGDVIEKGSIAEFGLGKGKMTFNRLPIDFFVRFQNSGNVHLRPSGQIGIKSMFGKEVGSVEVNASKGATLPKTTRKYDAVWEKAQLKGAGGSFFQKFFNEYANERSNFGFGKYTAKVSIHAGTNSIDDTATVSFWVVPWRILLVWTIVGILGLIFLILLIKRYNTWIRKKAVK